MVGDPAADRAFAVVDEHAFAARAGVGQAVRAACSSAHVELDRHAAEATCVGEPGNRRAPARRRRASSTCCGSSSGSSTRTAFLSPYGLRAVSRWHLEHPFTLDGRRLRTRRSTTSRPSRPPACSAATRTGAGRSGSRSTTSSSTRCSATPATSATSVKLEYPTGSGERAHARRDRRGHPPPADLALPRRRGRPAARASAGSTGCRHDPAWKDNILFNEYFHGDNGAGLGASHQTGWTGLVADMIRRSRGAEIPTLGGPDDAGSTTTRSA